MISAAADQVGICLYMMDTAIEYAKIRYQFGRAIGSQQAIKHRIVDMSLWAERASAALDYAARNSAHDTGHLTSLAALECCTRAAAEVTTSAIQVLGGIGMTWEHAAHLYLRRALSNQALFGAPRLIRHEIADLLWPRPTQPD
jgi:alkylation response protein AidB-like acyl-CoA dehydrogenase